MRIGFGFDAHELVEGKHLFLGGVHIEYEKGLRGHSDGDVVLHALSDAVLGSCAGGDIGVYFRDDDKKIEGIDSRRILEFALAKARSAGLKIPWGPINGTRAPSKVNPERRWVDGRTSPNRMVSCPR